MKTVSVAKFLPSKRKPDNDSVIDGMQMDLFANGFNTLHSIAERTEVGLDNNKLCDALDKAEKISNWKFGGRFIRNCQIEAICNALPELLVKMEKVKSNG